MADVIPLETLTPGGWPTIFKACIRVMRDPPEDAEDREGRSNATRDLHEALNISSVLDEATKTLSPAQWDTFVAAVSRGVHVEAALVLALSGP